MINKSIILRKRYLPIYGLAVAQSVLFFWAVAWWSGLILAAAWFGMFSISIWKEK